MAQYYECTKCHGTVHFKVVTFMLCEFHLKNKIKKIFFLIIYSFQECKELVSNILQKMAQPLSTVRLF